MAPLAPLATPMIKHAAYQLDKANSGDDVVYISLINVLHQIVDVHIFRYCKARLLSCFPGEMQINMVAAK